MTVPDGSVTYRQSATSWKLVEQDLFGFSDQALQTRLQAGRFVRMDQVLGPGAVEFLRRSAKTDFRFLKISGANGFTNLANALAEDRLGGAVLGAADDVLAKTLFGTGVVGHSESNSDLLGNPGTLKAT
jgi:hypothetical protein